MLKKRRYNHKFLEVVTDKYVLRYSDRREDMPKEKTGIMISGVFKEEANLDIKDVRELRDALTTLLKSMPKQES